MELAKQIYQPLHHFHAILTEADGMKNKKTHTTASYVGKLQTLMGAVFHFFFYFK